MKINRNHGAAAKFVTLCHELAHLTLGHLGADKKIRIPDRSNLKHAEEELEAESVAYLVCARNDIQSDSQKYLASYVSDNTSVANLDIYQIMRAAGQVETLLGLGAHSKFD